MKPTNEQRLNLPRTLKLGTFHIGSSFIDLLTSGVLNRILITDLALAATPVALLSALRYLLAPLSVWAGYRSDLRPPGTLRRLPFIWGGRLPMLLSLPILPFVTALLAEDPGSVLGWSLAFFAFLIYGIGTLISGATYLSLVRDSAPPARRGQALAIVQVFLVISFPLAGVIYGRLMPVYDQASFWRLVLIGMTIAFAFIAFALWGAERPAETTAAVDPTPPEPFLPLLRQMWSDPRARWFFMFLALGAVSAFAQDAVLEPFGGDVFGLDNGQTTRFNAYWGAGVVLSLLGTVYMTRHRAAHEQTGVAKIGLALTGIPLFLLSVIALTEWQALLIPVLVLFGLGFGIYTVGAVSLLAAMTTERHAAAYLGLWSMTQLLFRGLGIFAGGAIRDIALFVSGSYTIAYAGVFLLEALGLFVCIAILQRVDVPGFVRGESRPLGASATLAAADG
ncbi:BCD family MFS transporter [Chloroflexus aggregans]|uniref:PUCC protein n=1 Tax=Chloroflexus aggregans (strain MD-66 / DSM 9485) TaxID=326427 RepID=B8G3S4_CHLAD|nr:BCD family MFS transporter [Chloroflexus aggregans]ACL23457.1 PUCC protein [Chloroflexus aggregans DSM 9485]